MAARIFCAAASRTTTIALNRIKPPTRGGPYLVQEFRHIVDVVVDDEPDALVAVVRGNLGQRILLVLGHVVGWLGEGLGCGCVLNSRGQLLK